MDSPTVEGSGSNDLRYLELKHNELSYTLSIPSQFYEHAAELRDTFLQHQSSNTESDISSTPEFALRFIDFAAKSSSSETNAQLLQCLWSALNQHILRDNDIHVLAASLDSSEEEKLRLISLYYSIQEASKLQLLSPERDPALVREQIEGRARIYGVFGGQGNTKAYFDELRQLYATYPSFIWELLHSSNELFAELSNDPRAADHFAEGFDPLKWLDNPQSTPSQEYLISAPVSVPLIGLLQLAYYAALSKTLGRTPGQFLEIYGGLTGHSQGIVVAAAVAVADTWDDFQVAATNAIKILFWIGARGQQVYQEGPLESAKFEESIENEEGTPSPMLSVSGIPVPELRAQVDNINRYLSEEAHASISLLNGHNNSVVSGPRRTLCALNTALRLLKNAAGSDQNRIPFSQRKYIPTTRFLPVTLPFHSKILEEAVPIIEKDLVDVHISPESLRLAVSDTQTGEDLRSRKSSCLVPELVRIVMSEVVDWHKSSSFPDVTHVIDLGPGASTGAGALTQRNSLGSGVRVIVAGLLQSSSSEFGSRTELLDRDTSSIRWSRSWVNHHGPSLVKASGDTFVDTKLSRLLGLPPFIVAGMTPSTTHWDFVAATMQAGYHVELAAGGYRDAQELTGALKKLQSSIPPGRGITINVIYINPKAIAWQIPLIKQLKASGTPIDGITIGGGVPSVDVATEYITTLGLKHISFKPSSVESIQQVIGIAKKNPKFPVILQWTGGRGGGHHSYEDFHEPIFKTYNNIRKCDNIHLVAGSGFGNSDDAYPYLTGQWSISAGKPAAMPFDGCLFGSRVMTCKEAHTSTAVKTAIVETEGLDDNQWERTYKGAAGGVITVSSELGEPIHVLATRGALFWAEMDRTVFKIDKSKRMQVLQTKRASIIKHLNDDFQKVWFGRKSGLSEEACEVGDMTYAQVLNRMVELMFVESQRRWIDDSYRILLLDFLFRVEERFAWSDNQTSLVTENDTVLNPYDLINDILTAYPEAGSQLLNAEDVHHFLHLCRRPGQKPVPFVPILDENFETWFKKDSLWQSEDLDAVVGQDAGRTFILQGPVAVKKSRVVDEPIKDVLDTINSETIRKMTEDLYNGEVDDIASEEYLGKPSHISLGPLHIGGCDLSITQQTQTIELSSAISESDADAYLDLLAGATKNWRHALFSSREIVQGDSVVENPVRRIFLSMTSGVIEITQSKIEVKEKCTSGELRTLIEVEDVEKTITLKLFTWSTSDGSSLPLILNYEYHPESPYAPIREVMGDRNRRICSFYRKLWLGSENLETEAEDLSKNRFEDSFDINKEELRRFNRATGYEMGCRNDPDSIPMDFAIVLSWKSVSKALLQDPIQGDVLNLVHLSNTFKLTENVESLKANDKIHTSARVSSIVIEDSGKIVEISCGISRDNREVMRVISRFLFRGTFGDFGSTFSCTDERIFELKLSSPKDIAVLASKTWFKPHDRKFDLSGATLVFDLQTSSRYQAKNVYSSIETTGDVKLRSSAGDLQSIGSVQYNAEATRNNLVLSYLNRCGSVIEQQKPLETTIPLETSSSTITIPTSNESYSHASGDFNPIHTSSIFASYVNLPGTITHGMYCSAAVRQVVERCAADLHASMVRKYEASFVGMVLPGDVLEVTLRHTAMDDGCRVVKVEARNQAGEKVLDGEALISQPTTALLFTGQGSQQKGMGMDLYESSAVARSYWDRADEYFDDTFGFRITDIVKQNPKELKVYFGGQRGRRIRQNYMALADDVPLPDGTTERRRVYKDINENTASYTHKSATGLLFTTQFTQPALTILELASFKDMESKGLVSKNSSFVGHSLGEYSALAAITDFMPFEKLLFIVFCRGLTMQAAVERDSLNRSSYGMVAVDPSRTCPGFKDEGLRTLVRTISETSGKFIEIVNFNIRGSQYVCAGDLRALDCLQRVIDSLNSASKTSSPLPLNKETYESLIRSQLFRYTEDTAPASSIRLQRGVATIPLVGVDVPFHSSSLLSKMEPFRQILLANMERERLDPERLVGKYIPNVTGSPFQITKEYFELVHQVTKSERVGDVLKSWEEEWQPRIEQERTVVVS
ncbi:beta subunit of fatty acid synthetase [Arachnomyces sp. PD_36]|nr:beta subunit of fatty acid synthetase [Arachnomyces sp. PD_36]